MIKQDELPTPLKIDYALVSRWQYPNQVLLHICNANVSNAYLQVGTTYYYELSDDVANGDKEYERVDSKAIVCAFINMHEFIYYKEVGNQYKENEHDNYEKALYVQYYLEED